MPPPKIVFFERTSRLTNLLAMALVGGVAAAAIWFAMPAGLEAGGPSAASSAAITPTQLAASPLAERTAPVVSAAPFSAIQASVSTPPQGYADLDAQLRPMTSLPAWAATRNFYAQMATADPGVSVAGIACGDMLCRIEIRQHGDDTRGDLAERIAATISLDDAAMAFAYADSDRSKLYVYLHAQLAPPEPLQAQRETNNAPNP